ncbi:MAG TPA: hypothetical protein VF598_08420 [Hymenobacter sp.]|jgi:hypothetical protein
MNSLQLENGGRPVANDDFLVLQNNIPLLGLPALLADLGPCVVSGCRLYQTGSQYNVGPGMVWDGINLLDFPGRSNVNLPAMFAPGTAAVVDERAYQTGGTKTTIRGQSMDLVPVVAGAPNLVLNTWGTLTFWHRNQEKTRYLGEVQLITNLNTNDYDTTGCGKPGTEAWGWALCDGRSGRADLRGRFVAGLDPARADYDTVGKTGGVEEVALNVAQIPPHSHRFVDKFNRANSIVDAGRDTRAIQEATETRNTDTTGGGQAHENRPPFYVLAMRQWVRY